MTAKIKQTPFDTMPAGLKQLYALGKRLGVPNETSPNNFRVVVSVPTRRLASTALALGAMETSWDCDHRCGHRVIDSVPHRAAFYDDQHLKDHDACLDDLGRVRVSAQNSFVSNRGIHLLPERFPLREQTPRGQGFEAEIADLAQELECDMALAGIERSELGVHPVVVAGYVSHSRDDVMLPGSPLAALHPLGRLAPGGFSKDGEPGWFRYPVLLAKELPEPEDDFQWLSSVEPRLVVYVGMNAAQQSCRYIWPRTPAVVLLGRRSSVSADALKTIENLGWNPESTPSSESAGPLRPGNGLEISCWTELGRRSPDDAEEEEPEW
jgi:hypothetical protein